MKRFSRKKPIVSVALLAVVGLCCLLAGVLTPYGPAEMDSLAINAAPGTGHLLGTDHLGRDLLSMLLYGGRISLYIGLLSAAVSTGIGVVYGTVSGLVGPRMSDLLMRLSELLMSVPSILLVLFLQAIWGEATPTSIAVVIGLVSWVQMAKVVRSEVRQIRESEYVLAARLFGGKFWYVLRKHLAPNFFPAILFMVVSSIGQAILTESTLSFLGLGLPLTTMSWGRLLSMAQELILTGNWWCILIPGLVLVACLVAITQTGEYLRGQNSLRRSNL